MLLVAVAARAFLLHRVRVLPVDIPFMTVFAVPIAAAACALLGAWLVCAMISVLIMARSVGPLVAVALVAFGLALIVTVVVIVSVTG